LSIIKKIASAFGKKDEPKQKEATQQQKPSASFKKKPRKKPAQEEWTPGGSKEKKAPQQRTQQKRQDNEPLILTEAEQVRMSEFRPEEEDRRLAYEKRLRRKRAERSGSDRPRKNQNRTPKPEGERQSRPEGERKPRPKAEDKPRTERKPKPPVDDGPWDPSDFKAEPEEGKILFHDLGLHPNLMRSIHALGWKQCTPIQGEILPGTLKGKDMAGRAQTGTGKTAAFLISIINHCLNKPLQKQNAGCPRALIIAPTRELAMQIAEDSEGLNRFTGLRTVVLYGGMDYNKQERQLDELVDIVVATPGRLLDFASKSVAKLNFTEIMVIDEADRMLDMGFIPDVRRIIFKTPPKEKRQTVLFSATLSDDVMRLAAAWMIDPERIDIEPDQVAVDTVDQKVFIVTDKEKFPLLYNIIKNDNPDRIIVFANRRDQTERLADELERYSIHCEMLSGAVTQKKRMRILEDFKSGKVKVLVATDVAGRGIHVDGVSHVVNFNIPENPDDYVHRIGRTGRAGATGKSITFACEMESFELPAIEALLGTELKCTMAPEELLEELPHAPPRKRRPPRRDAGGSQGGRRPHGGGQRRSGGPNRGGGHRPSR
jgi:ATP-dependent RNA helicase RhlB